MISHKSQESELESVARASLESLPGRDCPVNLSRPPLVAVPFPAREAKGNATANLANSVLIDPGTAKRDEARNRLL